ncbi:MAG: hypothetical protein ACOCQD_02595 [archaeon]
MMKNFITQKAKNSFKISKTEHRKKIERKKELLVKEGDILDKLVIAVKKIAKETGVKIDLNIEE